MEAEKSSNSQLLHAKKLRQKADNDAQLLANRIALLKAEERRAQKKIAETLNKAQSITDIKMRNYNK
jgi:hypothetical protein